MILLTLTAILLLSGESALGNKINMDLDNINIETTY